MCLIQMFFTCSHHTRHCMWDCFNMQPNRWRPLPCVAYDQIETLHLELQMPAHTSLHAQQRLSSAGHMLKWLPSTACANLNLLMREGFETGNDPLHGMGG